MHRVRIGFTLLELSVVLLILGSIATIAIPRLSNAARASEVHFAAQRVANDLRYCRDHAINTGRMATVVFDATTNSYSCSDCIDPRGIKPTLMVHLDQQFERPIELVANFDDHQVVSFDLEGRPYAAGLQLQNDGVIVIGDPAHQRMITIDAATGEINVEGTFPRVVP